MAKVNLVPANTQIVWTVRHRGECLLVESLCIIPQRNLIIRTTLVIVPDLFLHVLLRHLGHFGHRDWLVFHLPL